MWQAVKTAFIELIWPIVQDLVVQIMREMSEWLLEMVYSWTAKRNDSNAATAEARADEYTRNAAAATSKDEAETNAKVAEVWREVAEMFRRENEVLASEVLRMREEAMRKAETSVHSMGFDDAFTEKDGKLSLKSPQIRLLK